MTSEARTITTEYLEWRGIRIEIRYERDWLGGDFAAHLELRSIDPPKAPLPVTETGYRSHFTHRERVEEIGGAAEYVTLWLEQEALTPKWRDAEARARQYRLF